MAAAKAVAKGMGSGHKAAFKEQCREAGMCDLLVCGVADRFGDDAEVAGVLLEAIAGLAHDSPVNQEALRVLGACALVPRLMADHSADKGVQTHGLHCCATLSWRNPKCQAALAENNVCSLISPAMEAFATDRSLQVEGNIFAAVDHIPTHVLLLLFSPVDL